LTHFSIGDILWPSIHTAKKGPGNGPNVILITRPIFHLDRERQSAAAKRAENQEEKERSRRK
jgi:hypothetical protein